MAAKKGIVEKAIERAVLNAMGVFGRKAANAIAEKAQGQFEKTSVMRKTKKKTSSIEEEDEDDNTQDHPRMIE